VDDELIGKLERLYYSDCFDKKAYLKYLKIVICIVLNRFQIRFVIYKLFLNLQKGLIDNN